MKVDLVQMTTDDGLTLDGAYFAASKTAPRVRALDAMLLVHGSGGNFYSKLLLTVAEGLGQAGYPSVSFNTRSHDLVWGAPGNFMGNSFDILDNCRQDLKAGIDWLVKQGHHRVGVFGHSMGAVKVAYYQAVEQDPRVAAVVPSSPVRLSHSYFLKSEGAAEHRKNMERAKALVDAGKGDEVFAVTFPMPHMFSAKSYLDKHGPEERYNLLKYVDKIQCPLLIMAGSLETHPRLRDCASDMYWLVRHHPQAKLIITDGADHGYTGMLDRLSANVVDWTGSLTPAKAGVAANN